MGFPSALSGGQKTTARASQYWQRTFVCFNPGEIVFQCEANEDKTTTPFKAFQWTNTLSGAYTDVWQGMLVYISTTIDYQQGYKYRGRVRLAPSATEFRIDLNATLMLAGDVITVVRDADLHARVRERELVDGSIASHDLPPMITGLPSVLVLYDSDDDGVVSYTPAQTGIGVADGATISSWLHSISGAGTATFTAGSSTSQHPTVELEAGFHYLWRVRVTDSHSIQHFVLMQVYVITRKFDAPVIQQVAAGSVSQDLENGYTASVTAYGGVADLPYRTHATVFCVERFGDNSSTAIVTNILMHGRLRSESITTEGSEEAGRLMQVTYPIEGMTSYLSRLKVPNDIVRAQSSPDEWGEMVNPTPYRRAVYFLFAYTTLLNLVSFSAGNSLFIDWKEGGEPISIDGGSALETLNNLLDRIKAAPNYAPDGEIRCEITASYLPDRSGLVTVMDFLPQDARSFTLDVDTSKSTAQVTGYGGVWDTAANKFILYTAQSPSIPYGDAPETRELTRELLQTDSTTTEAADELKSRTGNDFAFNNPKRLFRADLWDGHRWIVATNYQRYTWTVTVAYNLRNITLTTALKWQLQSVNITINTDGTYDVSGEFYEETEFTDAQSIASLLPDNLSGMNPVLPILSDDPASPDDPLWMFPTDTPTDAELMPIDPYSGYQKSPFSPDQAAQAAKKQAKPGCFVTQVNLRNSGTTTGQSTVNTNPYLMSIQGYGQISASGYHYHQNLLSGEDNFAAIAPTTWGMGVGYTSALATSGAIYVRRSVIENLAFTPANVTYIAVTFALTQGSYTASPNPNSIDWGNGSYTDNAQSAPNFLANGTHTISASLNATVDRIQLAVYCGYNNASVDPGGAVVIQSATINGTGTPPPEFTGATTGIDEFGDAFWRWTSDDASAVVFAATAGLLIDGAKPTVIPDYSPSHSYANIAYTGTGNPLQLNYALADYSGTASKFITVTTCKNS